MKRPVQPTDVQLREVAPGDLPIFFEHQLDPDATRLAAFPSRDRDAFMAHWTKILTDDKNTIRTILFNGQVAGNVACFEQAGRTLVGYWLGKEYWSKGIATQALSRFLTVVKTRPLFAHVANHNGPSIRVLQKCGFTLSSHDLEAPSTEDQAGDVVFKLEAGL